jgi:hypothetical protein
MNMSKVDRVATMLLLTLGVLTVGTGGYFHSLRPPLLPEDVRVTGMTPEVLPAAMLEWLRIVFRTLGGFVAGFGILLVSGGAYMMTRRRRVLEWGAAVALLVAFGRFLASNVVLRSDYLWFIGALFALAVLAVSCLVWSARQRR